MNCEPWMVELEERIKRWATAHTPKLVKIWTGENLDIVALDPNELIDMK
jgi:hypothetical protein